MRRFWHILLTALVFSSCYSDNPVLPEEEPAEEDNVYLEFNKWVYQKMNHQYLWREDLPDSLDCDYDLAPRDFFLSLLSDKDRFSYLTTNTSYVAQARLADLGFAYQTVADNQGYTALQVLYVRSDALRAHGLKRGDCIRIVDSSDAGYSLQKVRLKEGVFEAEPTLYEVSGLDEAESSTVLLDTVYTQADKRIGYLCYLEFGSKLDLRETLKRFESSQITDLILDLRYNPGGYVNTCKFLCNCIVSKTAYGSVFQQCSYNDILSAECLEETGYSRTYSYFEYPNESSVGETLGVPLSPLDIDHLYVITSKYTASASEATIICLEPYIPVTVIGEQTYGKGVGSWTIADSKFRYALQPITMRYYNADGVSTPDDGIVPDVYMADSYQNKTLEIGDTDESLLNRALRYISGDTLSDTDLTRATDSDSPLTPIGEPSYITDFKNKHYNESN